MSSSVESDELDKIIEVEDEAISAELDEAVAAAIAVDEATAIDEASAVEDDLSRTCCHLQR
jgi:hypothetical protein